MDHPFIDASELTDDELHQKIRECRKLLYSETYWGHTNVVNSIRSVLDTYEAELEERLFKRRHDETEGKNPDGTIEIGTAQGEVIDYDEVEKKSEEITVKRHKDL